jgi:hypothetical protein
LVREVIFPLQIQLRYSSHGYSGIGNYYVLPKEKTVAATGDKLHLKGRVLSCQVRQRVLCNKKQVSGSKMGMLGVVL